MKKFLLLTLVAPFALTGCETTGDPNSGGIFWSEDKAKVRLQEKQSTLHSIESDTARVNRKNRQLEGAAARKKAALGE